MYGPCRAVQLNWGGEQSPKVSHACVSQLKIITWINTFLASAEFTLLGQNRNKKSLKLVSLLASLSC